MMFNDPELSSDLEWMLRSDQASYPMLAEALITRYYAPLYRLALALFGSPVEASRNVQDTFVAALADVHAFQSGSYPPGEKGVALWLYAQAFKVFRREKLQKVWAPSQIYYRPDGFPPSLYPPVWRRDLVDLLETLPEAQRLPVALHYLLGWSMEEMAAVLGAPEPMVETSLDSFLDRARSTLTQAAGLPGDELHSHLTSALADLFPSPHLNAEERQAKIDAVLLQAQAHQQRGRRKSGALEVLWVALAAGVILGAIWSVNRLLPEPEIVPLAAQAQASDTPTHYPQVTSYPAATSTLASTPTPFPVNVFYTISPGDSLEKIAVFLNVDPEELRRLNRLPEKTVLKPGQVLLIPGRLILRPRLEFTPVVPAPTQQPLNAQSSPEEILQRSQEFGQNLQTLWLDLRFEFYNPRSVIGPPQFYRLQIWFSPNRNLFLVGSSPDTPDIVALNQGGEMPGQLYLADPHSPPSWFTSRPWDQNIPAEFSLFTNLLNFIFGDTSLSNLGNEPPRVVAGQEAGRQALQIDGAEPASGRRVQTWLDAVTGFPLRRIVYAAGDPSRRLYESRIIKISVNADFPPALLDPRLPWRGGFAANASGEPGPSLSPEYYPGRPEFPNLPKTFPPAGFTAQGRDLIFKYPAGLNYFSREDPAARVEVYAGHYYLGQIAVPSPALVTCSRSPDGGRLAFGLQAPGDNWGQYALHWYDLADLSAEHTVTLYPGDLAFSPDGERLAVFGNDSAGQRGIFIVTLESASFRRIFPAEAASSLVWSPDGTSLAFVRTAWGAIRTHQRVVIRASDGMEVFREGHTSAAATPAPWPVEDWGVPFPVNHNDLDACASVQNQ